MEVDGGTASILVGSYGGGSGASANLILYTANGTQAAPTATQAGDFIGRLLFQGWDTARSTGAEIRAVATAEWGTVTGGIPDASDSPTALEFWTVPDGGSALVQRMVIGSDGVVDVAGAFNVSGAATLASLTSLNVTGAATLGSTLDVTGLATLSSLAVTGAATFGTLVATTSARTPTLYGSASSNGNIVIEGTSHATKTTSYVLLQPNGGFVGINSSAPANRLEVIETTLNVGVANFLVNADDPVVLRGMTFANTDITGSSAHGMRFDFRNTAGASARGAAIGAGKEQQYVSGNSATSDAYLTMSTSLNGVLVERMHIASSGFVGFGTPTPAYIVHAYSDTTAPATIGIENSVAGGYGVLRVANDNGNYFQFAAWGSTFAGSNLGTTRANKGMLIWSGAGELVMGTELASDLGFSTTALRRMTITAAGLVGIGTATPGVTIVPSLPTYGSTPLLQVGGATPRLILRGTTDTAIDLIDAGAGGGLKWMQLITDGGLTRFRSADDAGGILRDTILTLIHSTGAIGIGDGAPGYSGPGYTLKIPRVSLSDPAGGNEHLWINSNGSSPTIHLRHASAGSAVPVAGEVMGQVAMSGRYDATNYSANVRAWMRFVAGGTWSSGNQPAYIQFGVTAGTTSGAVFEIRESGNLISTGTYNNTLTASGINIRPMLIDSTGNIGFFNLYNYVPNTPREAVYVNSSGTLGVAVSSRRYKENIVDMAGDLMENLVSSLRAVAYNEIEDANKTLQYGLIAEEVNAIEGGKPLVNYDAEGEPRSLSYERFIVPLISVVQRLQRRVDELERGMLQ
jgi:hypothetical protein